MISIVIPAYNEEKRIGKTLREIIRHLERRNYQYEIIVVDDGSWDRTIEVVQKEGNEKVRVLRNRKNRGKGYSVKRGIQEARYPLVLFSDSDLATPIEELEAFLGYSRDYDIVIASRNIMGARIKVRQPWYRQLMGRAFQLLVNLITGMSYRDTQCGFKLFHTEKAKKIVALQSCERFSFDVEILYIAKKLGYTVKEAPVVWVDKEGSTVNTIKDSMRMLVDVFKIRWNDLKGNYGGEPE